MAAERNPILTGGCQCGAVRYALYAEPDEPSICHCRMCQKAFGSYFAPFAGVKLADLAWTRGQPAVFKSSEAAERGFCRDCGTPLTFRYVETKDISVSIGSLDEPERVEPVKQYGVESKLDAFARLHLLAGETTDAAVPADRRPKLASRQHADRD